LLNKLLQFHHHLKQKQVSFVFSVFNGMIMLVFD
jgi:hypothetical protein